MALSERAAYLVQQIENINSKPAFRPRLPILTLPPMQYKKRQNKPGKTVTFEDQQNHSAATPRPVLFSKQKPIVNDDIKSRTQELLNTIQSKIINNEDQYLKEGNQDLNQDINAINTIIHEIIASKSTQFKLILNDFINLTAQLTDILRPEPNTVMNEQYIEQQGASHKITYEPSCLNPFAKCKAFYCE